MFLPVNNPKASPHPPNLKCITASLIGSDGLLNLSEMLEHKGFDCILISSHTPANLDLYSRTTETGPEGSVISLFNFLGGLYIRTLMERNKSQMYHIQGGARVVNRWAIYQGSL